MGEYSENTFLSLDPETFPEESQMVINFITDYYRNIENYPVQSQVKPGYLSEKLPKTAPYSPEPLEDILKDVTDSIIPGLTHWQSPNFFGYFPASASNAGVLGEMLCSGFNVVGFNWIASPAATELESIVMDWMGKMLKLPSTFLFSGSGGGVIHGTTCEAIVCTLAAARDQVLAKTGHDSINKLVVYCSDQTHFTLRKASRLIGLPSANFRCIPASFSTQFALSPEKLQSAIENDIKSSFVPLFLCATIGTTATCTVDPIKELGEIARMYNLWFHIDAAFAGSACICPEFRHYLDGVEFADSISLNPHKWFLTNMECCCLWVKKPKSLVQSLAMESELMRNSASESNSVVDYKDWQISLSRRFRALRLWFVIRRHGQANLIRHIRSDVNMAKVFEGLILKDKRFELVVPRRFALVCFRLKAKNESEGSELNKRLLVLVNQSGRAFMTHAVVGGVYMIRCAIGSTLTEERHVVDLWKLIQEKAQLLLTQNVAYALTRAE